MRLFRSDFVRSFAFGFLLGGIVVWTQLSGEPHGMVPSAIAAPAE
ncbi:MAG TPA: hypothetical protein VF440_09320 [Novosphingobium sp.]